MNSVRRWILPLLTGFVTAQSLLSQQVDPRMYSEMRWRMIGPFRASRTKAAVGIPDQPNVFFIGAVDGGVWKTDDYGRTWLPIFDEQPSGSIGAIAIAPGNPNIIYVGSGEGLQRPDLSTGDGIYRSGDGGKTWTHLGLRDGQQIPQIVVDPRDPNTLYVAVMGHPYGPNAERGLFKSTDGGQSFHKVLYKDENTGAIDVVMDPSNADVLYCAMWESRQGPWENGAFSGPGSGLFKSTDGGASWKPLTKGLPTFDQDGLGRIGLTIAPSMPTRMFATVNAARGDGLFRSDDAGETWYRATTDTRVASRESDFAEVKVDPKNPDVVYTASVVTWKSVDGGKTFRAFRGAPGGDDYHRIWINPLNPTTMIIASDQGAIVTVNGGTSWSSWLNQPTAAFYHVATDFDFPYRVCSGQQESGSACVRSRGDDGRILDWDWHPVGIEEYGYAAPDPLDPNIVFGGKVSRYDRRTGLTEQVGPHAGTRDPKFRSLRTAPLVFSMVDRHALYFAENVVWKTTTAGKSWTQISPDLTRSDSVVPPNVGKYADSPTARARHGGVIYTLAPSYLDASRIWAGTDDGLIHTTADAGAHWSDVTPAALRTRPWAKVSIVDAGHFDAGTAYAAVNTMRLDDFAPYIYRTHDGGRNWTLITNGIPSGAIINVVREDPKKKGLLFAGSEDQVWVSFDDGDHWSSLRLNMPATSVRDLVIKDDDIAIGTHGRSFFVLDDIASLREISATTATSHGVLFTPATAVRFRFSKYPDTPIPPDEPWAANPPDGAILDYYLGAGSTGDATLEIVEPAGRVIRTFSSRDTSMVPDDIGNTPRYWIRPTQVLAATPGFHRFVWDLRYERPAGSGTLPPEYPISASPGNTAREPRGPLALPGRYVIRLRAGGATYSQSLMITMDPRVKTTRAALAREHGMAMALFDAIARDSAFLAQSRVFSDGLAAARARGVDAGLASAIAALEQQVVDIAGVGSGGGRRGGRRPAGPSVPTLSSINGELMTLMQLLEEADAEPTVVQAAAVQRIQSDFAALERRWTALRTSGLRELNRKLQVGGQPGIALP